MSNLDKIVENNKMKIINSALPLNILKKAHNRGHITELELNQN